MITLRPLNREDKTRLIELLLIVGTLFAAFGSLPPQIIWITAIFALSAVVYYIGIRGTDEHIRHTFVALFVALGFSASVAYVLGVNLVKSIPQNFPFAWDFGLAFAIISVIYYGVFSMIIYKALTR